MTDSLSATEANSAVMKKGGGPWRFGLKSLLIVLPSIGVVIGLLARLLVESPDMFRTVMALLSTYIPFFLALGTLAWVGVRSRRRGLIAWTAIVLGLPVVCIPVMMVANSYMGPMGFGVLNTRRLIDEELPNHFDDPWVWRELMNRVNNGEMSKEDVDDAIKSLTAHMKATKPQGWDQPLHWQDEFIRPAIQMGIVSDSVIFDLLDATHGPAPVVEPLPQFYEGHADFRMRVEYGSVWGDHTGTDIELVWYVNEVLLDGTPLPLKQLQKHGNWWSEAYSGPLTAGEHKLTFEIEAAYIDKSALAGLNPDNLPPAQWPTPRKRWTHTIKAPLKVLPSGP